MSHYQPHVYCVTDVLTGKMYIGSRTKKNATVLNSKDYMGSSKDKEYLRNLQDRPSDFVKSIIAVCQTREDAITLENRILASIKNEHRVLFYNKVFWINGSVKFIPSERSQETRVKISAAMSGKKFSPEHKKALSDAKLGRVPWNKGVPATEIHKQRLSVSHMGKEPPNKGTSMSDAQRIKISESLKRNNVARPRFN